MDSLKLYVWEDVLCDYTCGLICILAKSEDAAWQLLKETNDVAHWSLTEGSSAETSHPKVYDSPCAFVSWGGG
jgi:hypothetical protein